MPKAKPGGYVWKNETRRIEIANTAIRRAVRRILEERPGPQTLAVLLARISLATGESDEAIRELKRIGGDSSVQN